jgi:hypothetical protein
MPDEPFPTGHVGTRVSKLSLLPKASRAGKRILGENHPVGLDCSRPPDPCLRDTVPGRARSDSVSVRTWGDLNGTLEAPRSRVIAMIVTGCCPQMLFAGDVANRRGRPQLDCAVRRQMGTRAVLRVPVGVTVSRIVAAHQRMPRFSSDHSAAIADQSRSSLRSMPRQRDGKVELPR